MSKATMLWQTLRLMWRLRRLRQQNKQYKNGVAWAKTLISEGKANQVHNALALAERFGFDSFDHGMRQALVEHELKYAKREQKGE